jgi:hypothetical protein
MSNMKTIAEMNAERARNEKPDTGEEIMIGNGLV